MFTKLLIAITLDSILGHTMPKYLLVQLEDNRGYGRAKNTGKFLDLLTFSKYIRILGFQKNKILLICQFLH